MPSSKKNTSKRRKVWKPPLPKKTLNSIHECWKESSTRNECLALIEERIPNISLPLAWGIVRKMSKIDKKWILTARQKEHEKGVAKVALERKREERAKLRVIREVRKEQRNRREELREQLKQQHMEKLERIIKPEFFFCPDIHQQVNNLSCVFRVFSNEESYGFSHCGPCLRCKRMDKHMTAIEETIRGGKK